MRTSPSRFVSALLLALIPFALAVAPAQPRDENAYRKANESGANYSPEEAANAERLLVEHPDDLFARAAVMGYYANATEEKPAMLARLVEHVVWLAENRPESSLASNPWFGPGDAPEGWARATKAFEARLKLEPENAAVLYNYAEFVGKVDYELRARLLSRVVGAVAYDSSLRLTLHSTLRIVARPEKAPPRPLVSHWSTERPKALPPKPTPMPTSEALGLFESVLPRMANGKLAGEDLVFLARFAFMYDELGKAGEYASEAMDWLTDGPGPIGGAEQRGWSAPSHLEVYRGHTLLGLLALRAGDVDAARPRLRSSVEHLEFDNFSYPSRGRLALAKEMLAAGEKEAVLEFLGLYKAKLVAAEADEDFTPGMTSEVETEDIDEWVAGIQLGLAPSRNDRKWNAELGN